MWSELIKDYNRAYIKKHEQSKYFHPILVVFIKYLFMNHFFKYDDFNK